VAVVAIAAATLKAFALPHVFGFVPLGLYGTDYQFLAEGAHRIALGQTPHVDFSAPIGALTFWLVALARRLPWLGPDLFAANALAWLLLAGPLAIVAARLPPWRALLLVATAALCVLSPFDLELAAELCDVNHNGVYNRYGAAFLLVTFASGFAPPGRVRVDAPLYAWLLGAMLLLKVNYALAGGAFLALACVFSGRRLMSCAAALGLLALGALLLQLATGIPAAYARDLAGMARLNAGNALPFLVGFASSQLPLLAIAVAIIAGLTLPRVAGAVAAARQRAWRAFLADAEAPVLAAAVVFLTLWTESQSTGGAGLVAWSALALVPGPRTRWALGAVAAVVALTAGAYAEQTIRRGRCVAAQIEAYRAHPALASLGRDVRAPERRLAEAEALAQLWRDDRRFAEEIYNRRINFGLESYGAAIPFVAMALLAEEAAAAVRARGLVLRHVTTLDVIDGFTPRLGLEPARGLKLFLDPYRTIGPLSADEASRYLAPVDGVFERTCAAPDHVRWIADTFRPVLAEEFEPVVLTPCWTLHRRRS
jgi:hypothetical protein